MKEELYIPHLPYFTTVSCGWSARIFDVKKDKIEGVIYIRTLNGKHIMPMLWDKYGMPEDLTKHPSKYYLRLL